MIEPARSAAGPQQLVELALELATLPTVADGRSAGTVSQEISDPAAVSAVVAEAERLARSGSPAEDAADPVADYPHSDLWDAPPATTGIEVLAELARSLGNADTYQLGGAFNCGKGQPGQVAPVSHGCPSALFRRVNVLNTQAEGADS